MVPPQKKRCLLAHLEATFDFISSEFTFILQFMVTLFCASKFATNKIERSFEISKKTPLGWGYHLFCCLLYLELLRVSY